MSHCRQSTIPSVREDMCPFKMCGLPKLCEGNFVRKRGRYSQPNGTRVSCVRSRTFSQKFKPGGISKEMWYWRFGRKDWCSWVGGLHRRSGGCRKKNSPCDHGSGKMGTDTSLNPMGCVQQYRQGPSKFFGYQVSQYHFFFYWNIHQNKNMEIEKKISKNFNEPLWNISMRSPRFIRV
jgi:hypothetical protein